MLFLTDLEAERYTTRSIPVHATFARYLQKVCQFQRSGFIGRVLEIFLFFSPVLL